MSNERKTESIVRSHFEQFKSILHIEEQASDNVKIDKLYTKRDEIPKKKVKKKDKKVKDNYLRGELNTISNVPFTRTIP
jgi:hypothetical protein